MQTRKLNYLTDSSLSINVTAVLVKIVGQGYHKKFFTGA